MPDNLLLITADQWRGECLSRLGHPVRTPNLDALAAGGVLFSRHYSNAVPCGPARASLHTGMYLMNHRSGTNGTPLDARHDNWAAILRRHGHNPVIFGYTDTSADPRGRDPGDPALTTYEGMLPGLRCLAKMGEHPDAWADWLAAKGYAIPQPSLRLYRTKKDEPEYEDGGPAPAALAIPAEHHDTRFMVDSAIEYIAAQGGAGWQVHLSLLRPHPPWIAPEPYNRLYPPAGLPGFVRAADLASEARQHPYLAWQLAQPTWSAPAEERKLRRLKASYYGLMTEVDDNLGRLFDWLRSNGQWERTLIVFTTDHGEQMGDHWLLGKCGYFDQSYHIPLIIRDPRPRADSTRGRSIDCFTEHVDLMPTILDFFGREAPVQCDGRSLLDLVAEGAAPANWRREAHWEFDFRDVVDGRPEAALGITQHQCALNVIRDTRYKYVHFTALPPLFFDLVRDPGESTDRSLDPDYREAVLAMGQKLLSWRMNHDEQTLTHITLTGRGAVGRPSPRY